MQVILLEKIPNLGDLGKVANVAAGFGRNYLIPFGKALPATKQNLKMVEEKRAQLEKKAQEVLKEAQTRGEKLSGYKLGLSALASEEGKLYGSIGTLEITRALEEAGFKIEKREVNMPTGPIHEVGEYEINLQLHPDVNVPVTIAITAAK